MSKTTKIIKLTPKPVVQMPTQHMVHHLMKSLGDIDKQLDQYLSKTSKLR